MVTVVALLSVDSVFLSPAALRDQVAAAHSRFHSPHGDHMTLLAVYQAYRAAAGKKVRLVEGENRVMSQAIHRSGAGKTLSIGETYELH